MALVEPLAILSHKQARVRLLLLLLMICLIHISTHVELGKVGFTLFDDLKYWANSSGCTNSHLFVASLGWKIQKETEKLNANMSINPWG